MEKILVLGSDYGTIEIVKEAKRQGLYVIVADYKETTPTKELADEKWLVSTPDIDKLEQLCITNKISAIITGASDFNINNSRKLCKRLGLPVYCSDDYAWKVSTDKYEFKKVCKSVGAPIATDYCISGSPSDDELERLIYPVVVKPVDKSGNKGMSYCSSKEELLAALKKARSVSENPNIIIERQLHGPEYAVNYLIANGEPQLFFFSAEHHQPGEAANLYSIINTTNYHLKQYIDEVNDKVIAVFKKAGLTEGIAWVECMLDDDGHFYLLEMGYRFGGEVVNIPYKDVCGFDSINWVLECATGKPHNPSMLPKKKYDYPGVAATYLLFTNKETTISRVGGLDKIAKLKNVLVDVTKRAGDKVMAYATMGTIRISAANIYELCEKIKAINDFITVEDDAGDNLIIKFDNYLELIDEYEKGLSEFKKEKILDGKIGG